MSNVTVAYSAAVEQPVEYQYNGLAGWQTIRRFRGSQADIASKESQLVAAGWNTVTREGPVWELEARIGVDARATGGNGQADTPVDNWELSANQFEKDLLQSNIANIDNITATDMVLLRRIADGQVDIGQYRVSDPAFTNVSSGDPVGAWKLLRAGVRSMLQFQPVLRHTQTVSRTYQIQSSLANAGSVITTAKMAQLERIPISILNNMPASSLVTRPDGMAIQTGWMKFYPQIQVSAYNKSQIIQEWQWGDWYPYLYTVVS